jgi:hypothetical protein
VSAAGTFTHKSPNGAVLERGIWISSQLISFDSYGIAPNALRQRGITPGTEALRPNRMPMGLSPIPAGGLAVFRIRLLPVSGVPTSAVLQVNCAAGDVPRERSVEGIRVKLEKNPTEFSEELSGSVMFLEMPQPRAPGKGQQEPSSGAAQNPNN